jgi:ketosteroid isomerase-like protein
MNNVELTQEFWRLWHDEGFAELLSRYDDFFTDDLEWRSPIAEMAGGHYVGREGFKRHIADLTDTFEEIHAEPVEVAEIAPDVVRSNMLMHGQGSSSGVAVDAPLIALARIRDGRICWAWGSFDLEVGERVAEAIARGEEVPV